MCVSEDYQGGWTVCLILIAVLFYLFIFKKLHPCAILLKDNLCMAQISLCRQSLHLGTRITSLLLLSCEGLGICLNRVLPYKNYKKKKNNNNILPQRLLFRSGKHLLEMLALKDYLEIRKKRALSAVIERMSEWCSPANSPFRHDGGEQRHHLKRQSNLLCLNSPTWYGNKGGPPTLQMGLCWIASKTRTNLLSLCVFTSVT